MLQNLFIINVLLQHFDVFLENFRNNFFDIEINSFYYDIHSFRKNEIQYFSNKRR